VALFHRERTGVGQKVEVSLLEAVIALQSWEAAEYLNTGVPPRQAGRGHGLASQLYGVFETQDGYLAVAGAWGKRWAKFCRALALDELIDDPRFATDAERLRHEELILPRVAEIFRQRSRAEWLKILEEHDILCGPVYSDGEVFQDPQVLATKIVVEQSHPRAGTIKLIGTPVKLAKTPPQLRRPAPLFGQHTDQVLRELGYSPEAIAHLREKGIIR
jgi:crotonobetainyl-CoA:carnitine CoA-transferase CaiB-like acyl-CoA transferase